MRRTIPVLVVVGLAVVVALLLINRDGDSPPDTLADATTTATSVVTTTVPPPTTTTTGASTTAATEVEVVETVEKAEAILRELWFGWFEGIYNQDEDRIREVVATEAMLNAGLNAFGSEFTSEPKREGILLETEILRSDHECLVLWSTVDVSSFRGPSAIAESVQVLRRTDDEWRFAFSWRFRNDLWEADCDVQLSPLPS